MEIDRKTLSKSAPSMGRRGSKEKTRKQTTLREINSWIIKGENNNNVKGSRNVGTLTENVTEQRLLYTRQLELGRERYKFLASHSYEKQKFVEHQNRKSRSMKKMMQNARRIIETSHTKPETPRRTITVRIPQMDETEISNKTVVEAQTPKVQSRPSSKLESRPDSKLARVSVERPPSKGPVEKKVHFPQPVRSGKKPILSGKNVYIDLSGTSNDIRKPPEAEKQVARFPSLSSKQTTNPLKFISRINSAASIKSEKSSIDKLKPNVTSLDISDTAQAEIPTERMSKWRLRTRNKIPQFGQKFSSSVSDPRYVALTNTLVPCDDQGQPVVSVGDIIAKKEILRGESKCEKNSRAKQLHARFIAYLLEQELR